MLKYAAKTDWKGYTFEELQYRKVVLEAAIESQRVRLLETSEKLKSDTPINFLSNTGAIMRFINFASYGVMAVKLFRTIRPLFKKK